MTWEHSKVHNDWSLFVDLPAGNVRGTVTFTNRRPHNYTVWGTVESTVGSKYEINVERYENPTVGTDAVSRSIAGGYHLEITEPSNSAAV